MKKLTILLFSALFASFCTVADAQTNKTTGASVSAVKATINMTPDSITVSTAEGKYYLYLAHSGTDYFLMISQNHEMFKLFKENKTGVINLEGAEIDPLDKFYKEVIKLAPANFKSTLTALNVYRMFRVFNYKVEAATASNKPG